MEPMLIGQTINKQPSTQTYFTGPWMPRRADVAEYGVEVIAGGSADFKWRVQTRTLRGVDPSPASGGADIVGNQTLASAPLTDTQKGTGAKDLVRYVIETGSNANTGYMHFQLLEPQWVDN